MATKLKKRRPFVTLLVFMLAVSGLIVCAAGLLLEWDSWSMADDYKNTSQYEWVVEDLLVSAAEHAVDKEPSAYLRATLESEKTNLAWFLKSGDTVQSHGVSAATKEEFLAGVRANSTLGGEGFTLNPARVQGEYAHLLVLDQNGLYEEKATRFFQSISSTTLARSAYPLTDDEVRDLTELTRPGNFTVCIAVRAEERLDNVGYIYQSYYEWYLAMAEKLTLAAVAGVFFLLWLIVMLRFGSRAASREAIARVMGKIWFEIKLLITVPAVGLAAYILRGIPSTSPLIDWPTDWIFFACIWWCWLVLVDLRVNKSAFWKHNSVSSITRVLHSLESHHPFLERMKRRAALLFCAEALILLLMAVCVCISGRFPAAMPWACGALALLGFSLLALYVRAYNRSMDELGLTVDYAHSIRTGTVGEALTLPQKSDFAPLADDLTCIHSGISSAVEERLRSEKMKAELVTNVSHDLKTPLTSIINYIGLLDKEELAPQHANDYVDILSQKAQRLSHLVQDLFEVSRANSGAVEMCPEKLDVAALVEQSIAELDEKTQRAGVEIKTQLEAPHIYALADGRQLHRVFENLLGNALKYSLAGTRVYISAREIEGGAEISFKNVAGYEMDFTAQDIVERFQRGDTARATEGSGLGLAIAKSFVELNGGTFSIELDGDLFKVMITLPCAEEEQKPEEPEALPAAVEPTPEAEPVAEAEAEPKAAPAPEAEPEPVAEPEPEPAAEAELEVAAEEPAEEEPVPPAEEAQTEEKPAEEPANV